MTEDELIEAQFNIDAAARNVQSASRRLAGMKVGSDEWRHELFQMETETADLAKLVTDLWNRVSGR